METALYPKEIYRKWFNLVDHDGDGRITGHEATKFFAMSKLSRQELKQVWAIADEKRQGFLAFRDFVFAVKLISFAQEHELTPDILKTEVDWENIKPPVMEGLDALTAEIMSSATKGLEVNASIHSQPCTQWFGSKRMKKLPLDGVTSIVDGLKILYRETLKPLELTYNFNDFVSPSLADGDFDAKPMVLLLGQHSTGKTTFIKHLLKCSYPGAHIELEPANDRFVVVMSGPDARRIPGNTIAVNADLPFSGLASFGGSFLSKFECAQMPHPLLDEITLVDTPGVLFGENQRAQRGYDFFGAMSWFAARSDLILLLLDPYKLDFSYECKRAIACLRGHDDKIRVILNNADQVNTEQLMRVYGSLMWSLTKVLNTQEAVRVYIGSFNDEPVNRATAGPMGKELFEKEEGELLADLLATPKKACDRWINEFVKRARAARIHAYVISHLKKMMSAVMGRAKGQQRLIDNLEDEFAKVQRELHLPAGDFPDVVRFREVLEGYDIDKFERLKPRLIREVDHMLEHEIPELLQKFKNPYE